MPQDVWWNEYYVPMKKYIEALPQSERDDPALRADIKIAEREIMDFGTGVRVFGSFCVVMQKAEQRG